MSPRAHLAVLDPARPGGSREDIRVRPSVQTIGAFRPCAVRALLARSVTMTAFAIERRIRARRRQPDSQARSLWLAAWREREAQRARYEENRARAGAARMLFSIR
jgi:hypothetical protein